MRRRCRRRRRARGTAARARRRRRRGRGRCRRCAAPRRGRASACLTAVTVSISARRVIVSGSMLHDDARRDVVDDDRPVGRRAIASKCATMPRLRRLVVVRRDDEKRVGAEPRGRARSAGPSGAVGRFPCRRRRWRGRRRPRAPARRGRAARRRRASGSRRSCLRRRPRRSRCRRDAARAAGRRRSRSSRPPETASRSRSEPETITSVYAPFRVTVTVTECNAGRAGQAGVRHRRGSGKAQRVRKFRLVSGSSLDHHRGIGHRRRSRRHRTRGRHDRGEGGGEFRPALRCPTAASDGRPVGARPRSPRARAPGGTRPPADARLRQEHRRGKPRQQLEQRLDIPSLVEHIGGEGQVEVARERRQSSLGDERESVQLGVRAQELDRARPPSRSPSPRAPRVGGHERRDRRGRSPARRRARPRGRRQRSRQRERRRPELGPVRAGTRRCGERLLVEQRLGIARAGAGGAPPPRLARSPRRARSEQLSSPTVTPGGSPPSFVSASSTPGTNASREVVSWRIVSSSPSPPRITSW